MTLLVIIYLLAETGITSCVLYEDNYFYADRQHVSDFTAVAELMFVMKQSRSTAVLPRPICQAMMKLNPVSSGEFRYVVYFATESARTNLRAFVTTLSIGITAAENGNRHHPNTLTFRTSQRGPFISFKLLYADPHNGCFILVTFGGLGGRVCRLLQSSRTVRLVIPRECIRIYTQNCPGESRNIYHPGCGTRLPHIVEWGR
uniref:Putative secreted protein n=1 Tax=Amblyomma triste TaxID=251400 RepID=A0A023GDZ3_AMBTT